MKKNYYHMFLKISAFFLPFFLIFYGSLHDNPNHPAVKSIRKFLLAGFCFYSILAVAIFVIKS